MDPYMIKINLDQSFVKKGFHYRTIKIEHVPKLISEINSKHESGDINPGVYSEYISDLDQSVPNSFFGNAYVLIAAVPQYQIDVRFQWRDQLHSVPIPPTYNHKVDRDIESILEKCLVEQGYRYKKAKLPLKLLATSSGLSQYGKNNISYIDELGSFYRLAAYYIDYPHFSDHWDQPKMLKQCETCKVCIKKCPNNAIATERFLIQANRCLTFINENSADFPDWLDPEVHHCVVGCMICQKHCPLNKHLNKKTDFKCEFTEEETEMILNRPTKENLPKETLNKLDRLCMTDDLEIISRNIRLCLDRSL